MWRCGKRARFSLRGWMKKAKGAGRQGSQVGPELSSQILSPGTKGTVDRRRGRLKMSGD